jgi:hypothetical protein
MSSLQHSRPNIAEYRATRMTMFFDGAWCPQTNESEGAILVGDVAHYWRRAGLSSSPEAELRTSVMAARWARQLVREHQLAECLILGDNHQAIGQQAVRIAHLRKYAQERVRVMQSFRGGQFGYIASEFNPADEVIRKIRAFHKRGQSTPSTVIIASDESLSSPKAIAISRVPGVTVGSSFIAMGRRNR